MNLVVPDPCATSSVYLNQGHSIEGLDITIPLAGDTASDEYVEFDFNCEKELIVLDAQHN
jgi:hypothetical protein